MKMDVRNQGLAGVVTADTAVSMVDGEAGRLIYRGYDIRDLCLHYEFEDICYLLWHGRLPDQEEKEALKAEFREQRKLSKELISLIQLLPENMPMMSVIRTCISSLGGASFSWPPTSDQAVKLTAIMPVIIAVRYRWVKEGILVEPNEELSHTANYLYMLHGSIPEKAHLMAMNAYLILTMEHGMNASTFTSRVITSTESDFVSAVTGAIGAMKGPLHGGAPSEVTKMLGEIGGKSNVEPWLRDQLEHGYKLMGFGHRVYKTQDPRAEALKEVTASLVEKDDWLELAHEVEETAGALLEEYKPGRKLYTNVEFYAAAVLRAVQMPDELFTATFTASRIVGWSAHVLEQAENNRIYRPEAHYTGIVPK